MSFDVTEWLEEDHGGRPRHERLCWLLYCNGGPAVHEWGVTSTDKHGHQIGLEMEDAIELMQVSAFMTGLAACGVDVLGVLTPMMDAYRERVRQTQNVTLDVHSGTIGMSRAH